MLIAAGRQSGKTAAACLAAIWNATCRPDLDDVLPPGDERYILVAAPGLDQARQFIRRCNGMLEHSRLGGLVADRNADEIVFRLERVRARGPYRRTVIIRALPANSPTIRGRSASLVIVDEVGSR